MIKYGESKIDKIMFGEQMVNRVMYGESLIWELISKPVGDPLFTITSTVNEPGTYILNGRSYTTQVFMG